MRHTNPSRRHLLGAFLAGLFGCFHKTSVAQSTGEPGTLPTNSVTYSASGLPPGVRINGGLPWHSGSFVYTASVSFTYDPRTGRTIVHPRC